MHLQKFIELRDSYSLLCVKYHLESMGTTVQMLVSYTSKFSTDFSPKLSWKLKWKRNP